MCIAFWTTNHPDYSLVLCTNRDEYLSRPTKTAHWHSFESLEASEGIPTYSMSSKTGQGGPLEIDDGFVLSGTDMQAGGTWFGINRHGDVALLTNITEPYARLSSSRGHLCSSFLLRNQSIPQTTTLSQFVDQLTGPETLYAGFNLLLLAPEHMRHPAANGAEEVIIKYDAAVLSNGEAGKQIRSIPPVGSSECHCITNDTMTGVDSFTGLTTDSEWPKSVQGRELFSNTLSQSGNEREDALVEKLFLMLRTKNQVPPKNRREFQETIMVDALDLLSLRGGASFTQTPRPSQEIDQKGESSQETSINSHKTKPTDKLLPGTNVSPQDSVRKYYATRLSTVLLIRKDGRVLFVERDAWILDKDNRPLLVGQEQSRENHERRHSFQIS